MDKCIEILRSIKKDELDERTFYEQVLSALTVWEDYSLNPHDASKLKGVLEEIGCVRYDVWKKEKEEKGESVEDLTIGEGMEHADIGTAVSFVSQLLGSYKTASYGLSKMLDGGEKYGWVQTWLRNSAELRENEPEIESSQERFSEKIKGLAEIKKEEMDERTFYEEVLKVVVGLDGISLTPEIAQQLKEALEATGCVRYDAWKKEKEAKGESVEDLTIGEGMEQADIGTAVNFVSQLLGSYSTASYGLSKMLDGGEKYGWVQTWLRNSAELRENEPEIESSQERFSEKIKGLAEIKKEEMDERTFYEEVLKVVVGLDGTSLTPETAQQLKEALEAAGCVRYDAWKKEKEAKGEKVPNLSVGEGMKQADIGTAVNFVAQLLGSYDTASFGLPYMLDGGEDYGWVQTWLRNSANVREMDAVLSPGEKPVPPIKSEIVAANKDMAVTQNDILGTGKRLFDKLMAKIRGKNKDDRKDEI